MNAEKISRYFYAVMYAAFALLLASTFFIGSLEQFVDPFLSPFLRGTLALTFACVAASILIDHSGSNSGHQR